jgi:pre-mRNA-splicing factor SPF27
MGREFDRMLGRGAMEVLSMKRYELPPPPAGKLTDLTAWTESLENSYAQLEHQAVRFEHLFIYLYLQYICRVLNYCLTPF